MQQISNEKQLNVFVMDLLCISPFYDRYLCEALQAKNASTYLGAISFHLDINYFERYMVRRYAGLIDLVAKLRIRNKIIRRGLKTLEYALNLLNLLLRFTLQRPDIIHIEWLPLVQTVPVELWFLKIMKKRGVRLVYTVHNVLPHDTGLRYKPIFSRIYDFMDALICHTREAKEQLVSTFKTPASKIWVIPHGPMFHDSFKITRAEARTRLGCQEDLPIVLFFGAIRPYKGLEYFLEVWRVVTENCPEARLMIAGNGDKEYIQRLKEKIDGLGLNESVVSHFRFIPNEELPVFHQAADIFVYPYQAITQSGALFTGMAFGKAIVATSVGGFKETLQHNVTGLLIKYGDIQEWVHSLIYLIKNPSERLRLGQAALKEMNMHYSWDVIAEKTLECYCTISKG
ncbi:hypothetical protein SY88_00120 [Clostridiales bacterium PH28_bin88]|nr:hypothetical protein SY88_00120 [Clostridiales bacterium PH28_bin88]